MDFQHEVFKARMAVKSLTAKERTSHLSLARRQKPINRSRWSIPYILVVRYRLLSSWPDPLPFWQACCPCLLRSGYRRVHTRSSPAGGFSLVSPASGVSKREARQMGQLPLTANHLSTHCNSVRSVSRVKTHPRVFRVQYDDGTTRRH